jgi:hypothetical protein
VLLAIVLLLVSQAAVEADGEPFSTGAGRDVTVRFHIRVVTCADDVFRYFQREQRMQGSRDCPETAEILAIITPLLDALAGSSKSPLEIAADIDHDQWYRFLRAIQGDGRTKVEHVSELTLSSGQAVTIRLPNHNLGCCEDGLVVRLGDKDVSIRGDLKPETTFTVQPVVSGDLRQVRLRFQMTNIERTSARQKVEVIHRLGQGDPVEPTIRVTTENNQPLFQTTRLDQTRTIAAGHSVVFPGWTKTRQIPEKIEERPVLSKIPLVNRLFEKKIPARTENDAVLIVVTPQVIVTSNQDAAANARGPHPADQPQ